MNNEDAVTRLRVVQDQVLAVVAMLDEPDRCVEAVRRIKSAQQTLNQIAFDLLEQHLTLCVANVTAQTEGNYLATLADIQELFRWTNRVGLVK